MHKIIGIDVSKKTLDASFEKSGKWIHVKVTNDSSGFQELMDLVGNEFRFVMEASGAYHLCLANSLVKNGYSVSVVNPLSIRRYAEMTLSRAKTDKKDAKLVAEYGSNQPLADWQPQETSLIEMRQKMLFIKTLDKQIHVLERQLESMQSSGIIDKFTEDEIQKLVSTLKRQKTEAELQLEQVCNSEYGQTMKLIQSIPGIGTKTSMMFIMYTNNFKKFEHFKQFIAYAGLSPKIRQSGTSLNARARICKMGNGYIRRNLFMCTLSAQQYNPACKRMKQRLLEKGKAKMLINIAIANKLIKQVFAIVKSGEKFSKDFQPNTCF